MFAPWRRGEEDTTHLNSQKHPGRLAVLLGHPSTDLVFFWGLKVRCYMYPYRVGWFFFSLSEDRTGLPKLNWLQETWRLVKCCIMLHILISIVAYTHIFICLISVFANTYIELQCKYVISVHTYIYIYINSPRISYSPKIHGTFFNTFQLGWFFRPSFFTCQR